MCSFLTWVEEGKQMLETNLTKMKDLENLEIINISTKKGKSVALVSFQDISKIENLSNGYDTMEIPINPREIQTSIRENMLVDQSVKNQDTTKFTYIYNNPIYLQYLSDTNQTQEECSFVSWMESQNTKTI
jgi:hypothetical protein